MAHSQLEAYLSSVNAVTNESFEKPSKLPPETNSELDKMIQKLLETLLLLSVPSLCLEFDKALALKALYHQVISIFCLFVLCLFNPTLGIKIIMAWMMLLFLNYIIMLLLKRERNEIDRLEHFTLTIMLRLRKLQELFMGQSLGYPNSPETISTKQMKLQIFQALTKLSDEIEMLRSQNNGMIEKESQPCLVTMSDLETMSKEIFCRLRRMNALNSDTLAKAIKQCDAKNQTTYSLMLQIVDHFAACLSMPLESVLLQNAVKNCRSRLLAASKLPDNCVNAATAGSHCCAREYLRVRRQMRRLRCAYEHVTGKLSVCEALLHEDATEFLQSDASVRSSRVELSSRLAEVKSILWPSDSFPLPAEALLECGWEELWSASEALTHTLCGSTVSEEPPKLDIVAEEDTVESAETHEAPATVAAEGEARRQLFESAEATEGDEGEATAGDASLRMPQSQILDVFTGIVMDVSAHTASQVHERSCLLGMSSSLMAELRSELRRKNLKGGLERVHTIHGDCRSVELSVVSNSTREDEFHHAAPLDLVHHAPQLAMSADVLLHFKSIAAGRPSEEEIFGSD